MTQIGKQIVIMTDDPSILFLSVDHDRLSRGGKTTSSLLELDPSIAPCMSCHHLGPTNPSHMAPSLSHLQQRNIAANSFDHYSSGLLAHSSTSWTKDLLAAFLKDPASVAPGTTMPNLNLRESEIDTIVNTLN